jgi:diacylglycerol kinase (ATP)
VVRHRYGEPELCVSRTRGLAEDALRRVLANAGGPVIIAGGDGSVHLAINATDSLRVPLAVIPMGTANDLSRALNARTSQADPFRVRHVDLLRVNGRRLCTVGGLGVPADIAARVNHLRRRGRFGKALSRLGTAIYPLIAAEHVLVGRSRPLGVRLRYLAPDRARSQTWDELCFEGYGLFLCNQSSLGGNLVVSPESDHADGTFELAAIRVTSRLALLRLLAALRLGRRISPSVLKVVRAVSARIETSRPVSAFGDGEPMGESSAFAVEIEPRQLPVIAPPAAV